MQNIETERPLEKQIEAGHLLRLPNAVIGDRVPGKVVGPNLLVPVHVADLTLPGLVDLRHFLLELSLEKFGLQFGQRILLVQALRSFLLHQNQLNLSAEAQTL